MKEIRHINDMPKTGTSRAYRKQVLQAAGEIAPEERDLEDLLSMTIQLAKRVKYINYQNEHKEHETWVEFFSSDPTFVLADILSFDSGQNQAGFENKIKQLKYLLFIGESADDTWHHLMHVIFDLLVKADSWLSAFKQTEEALSGFRKELWSVRSELQSLLNDLIRLHHQFEKLSGHEMDMAIDELVNFKSGKSQMRSTSTDPEASSLNHEIIGKLEEIYREFSNNLHHLKGAAERYFRRSFLTKNHEPHTGLLIAFLQLYRELSSNFNDYTAHHRSFYYEEVLRQLPKTATPDKAVLIFSVSEGFKKVSLPENTLFPAGQTEAGEEISFQTTSPIALNRAEIKKIRTFMLGNNELYKPSGDYEAKLENGIYKADRRENPKSSDDYEVTFVTGIYVADRTELNLTGEKWPLLGEDQTDMLKQNRTMQDALVGFALSSPAFYLKGGERDIRIRFHLSEESYHNFMKFVTDIALSEKRTDKFSDKERIQGLLIRLFLDGFLLDYSSDEGWVEKQRFSIDIKSKTDVLKKDNSKTVDSDRIRTSDPILEVSFKLGKDEPPVSGYKSEIHGMNFRKPDPVIRLRLNPDAHLFPYSLIRGLKIYSTNCDIDVSGLNDLVVFNEAWPRECS